MPAPSAPSDPLKGAVYGDVQPTDSSTKAGYVVTAYLVGPDNYAGAFLVNGLIAVPKTHTATTDSDGRWSFELYGNDEIVPGGSYWRVTEPSSHLAKAVELAAGSVVNAAEVNDGSIPTGESFTPPATFVTTSGSYANPSWLTSLAWSKLTGTPTTLAGYGITDGSSGGAWGDITGTLADQTDLQAALDAKGSGTVTTVGWTGGIVSVANGTTTPAFTIAGTSGGVPYFDSTSTWASSGALAANAIVIGGGAGAAPSTTTTGTGVLTALGVNVGNSGAFVVFGGAGGTPSSLTLTNATGLPVSTGISGMGTGAATALAAGATTAGYGTADSGKFPVYAMNGDLHCSKQLTIADDLVAGNAATLELLAHPRTNGSSYITCGPITTDREIFTPDLDGTIALLANKLSAFAATTSIELSSVISDETGSGALVFATSPTLTTPVVSGSIQADSLRLLNEFDQTYYWEIGGLSSTLSANRLITLVLPNASATYTFPASNTTVPIASQQITWSGPTAARTYTLPDASVSLAQLDANTFTGAQTVSNTTDSTSGSTGSINTLGGLGVTKSIYCAASILAAGTIDGGGPVKGNYIYIGTVLGSGGEKVTLRTVSDGILTISKWSQNGMTRVNLGGTTSSYAALQISGTTITSGLADGASGGTLAASGALTVSGDVSFGKTITAGGTTGAQTINKTSGSVNFAAAATSLVVTNSLCTASSVIHVTIATNDATAAIPKAVAGSGSFTIYLGTAPTGETRVNFTLTN